MANEMLALAYDQVDVNKAERLRQCATELVYTYDPTTGLKRLKSANFCRVRLCPMCQWRRALKTYLHMTKIYNAVEADRPRSYIYLTLTMRNMPLDELGGALDQLTAALNRLMGYARVKQSIKGWYRGIEITHNPNTNTYHPHVHMLLCVNKRYYKSNEYIKQSEWTEMWQRALRADYTPIIDVRRIKGDMGSAVAECAKYAVKESTLIHPDDWDLTVETVKVLDKVLNKRRFVAYGGIFKDWHRKLNLDDEQDGDLVYVDGDEPPTQQIDPIIVYTWRTGYSQYVVDINR